MPQHFGQYNKYNLCTPYIYLLDIPFGSWMGTVDNCLFEVEIHHVFGFKEEAAD
jgi:hypothetical protein